MKFNIGDKVAIEVTTNFGTINVDFLIVDHLQPSNEIYIGYAKKNLAKIQYKVDKKWYVLENCDLTKSF